ncbi:MAG: glycosyltransferase family 2 protein, partial [Azovibrio sp.]
STGDIVMALDGDTSFDNDMVRMVTRHFVDPRVCAVSGALVARNAKASLVTRLQSLEYTISLIFSKTGLSVFNIVNNVSGAFGVFRRTMLKQVGGWSTGTAEDLDMTLRIKQYMRRTGFIIRFEPFAIGKTDVPDKWHIFLLQRLRWDGDLGYLYMRKHVMAFQPRLIGWPNYIILIWNGLLMQIALPFVILIYTVSLVFILPLADWVALNLFILFYYSGVTVVMFACHMIMTSRNRYEDMRLAVLLPIFCLYAYVNRLWSCVALLNEGLRRGHEESSMAPWWVLRRNKF